VRAAENALVHHQYVSAIDVLTGMGLLALRNLEAWRKGRVDFLERVIQGNLKKISLSMAMFRRWAHARGLRPSETRYVRRTRMGTVNLQFSKSGDPALEKSYRTHYVSPALSERKQQQIKETLSRAAQHRPMFRNVLTIDERGGCSRGTREAQGSHGRGRPVVRGTDGALGVLGLPGALLQPGDKSPKEKQNETSKHTGDAYDNAALAGGSLHKSEPSRNVVVRDARGEAYEEDNTQNPRLD